MCALFLLVDWAGLPKPVQRGRRTRGAAAGVPAGGGGLKRCPVPGEVEKPSLSQSDSLRLGVLLQADLAFKGMLLLWGCA